MSFLSRFYYNDNAGEGGGAENKPDLPIAEPSVPSLSVDELKEFGFQDLDSLRSHLRSQKESNIPEEEKRRNADLEKANLLKFSTENGLMTVEDYNKFESLKARTNRDLVFDRFAKEYKEDFEDASDDDIKDAFESEYRLNSDNEKAKVRGEGRLEKEAESLRKPFTEKFTVAEKQYAEDRAMRGKFPEFNKFIDSLIEKNTPEKLVLSKIKDGDSELEIDVELTKEQREELAKTFRTPKAFQAFIGEADQKKVEEKMSRKIRGFLMEKNFDAAISKGFELGKGIGMKNGSNVGADNLYALQQANKGKEAPIIDLHESNKKIANAREQYRNK